jgi:hypothetical protein
MTDDVFERIDTLREKAAHVLRLAAYFSNDPAAETLNSYAAELVEQARGLELKARQNRAMRRDQPADAEPAAGAAHRMPGNAKEPRA